MGVVYMSIPTPPPFSSLAPKNWQLPTNTNPTSTGVKSYANLTSTYNISGTEGSIALREAPLYFVRSGAYYYNGNINNLGPYGNYWSSTASNTASAYGLYFYSTNVDPQNSNTLGYRGYGYSVRCVAR